ncbi:MAG: hypothetical protein LUD12_02705 [Lachnospiraceae bacterium]|nr:hypothetical protein [Lachnospiraceae bacterium]
MVLKFDMTKDILRIENFIIYGYTGTVTETYAEENDITFVTLTDASGD